MSERRDTQRMNPRRELALRVAMEVISERGVAQTRYRDVAEASGVPVATLQYMFGSRENLLVEALDHSSVADLVRSRERAAELEDPVEQLHAVLALNIDHPTGERGWRLWLDYWQNAQRDAVLLERSISLQDQWQQLIAEIVQRGREVGRFNTDLDATSAAVQILALLDGIAISLLLQTAEPDYDRARRLLVDAADRLLAPR